ncbi:MAG: winged helix-turn-helix domain-containing protein [Dysgonomonas sp.]
MIKDNIGTIAGTIWTFLETRCEVSLREIGEKTGQKDTNILLALGWLARENKIILSFEANHYRVKLMDADFEFYF